MIDKSVELARYLDTDRFQRVGPHPRVLHGPMAEFAKDMIRTGMMMHLPTGRIVGGVQMFRMMTEQEVIDRAIKLTELAFAEFVERGWSVEVPPFDDLRIQDGDTVGFRS